MQPDSVTNITSEVAVVVVFVEITKSNRKIKAIDINYTVGRVLLKKLIIMITKKRLS